MINLMEKEYIIRMMGIYLKEIIKMEKEKEKGYIGDYSNDYPIGLHVTLNVNRDVTTKNYKNQNFIK